MVAATAALGVGDWLLAIIRGRASTSVEETSVMLRPEGWLWLLVLFVGATVIERRTKRYRRAYPEKPLTLALR